MTEPTAYELDKSVILAFHDNGMTPDEIANLLAEDGISYGKIKRIIADNRTKFQVAWRVKKARRRDEYFRCPCTCERPKPNA